MGSGYIYYLDPEDPAHFPDQDLDTAMLQKTWTIGKRIQNFFQMTPDPVKFTADPKYNVIKIPLLWLFHHRSKPAVVSEYPEQITRFLRH